MTAARLQCVAIMVFYVKNIWWYEKISHLCSTKQYKVIAYGNKAKKMRLCVLHCFESSQ